MAGLIVLPSRLRNTIHYIISDQFLPAFKYEYREEHILFSEPDSV